MYWNSLNAALRRRYGTKVYKLALSSGCTCPNRDGTLGSRGCIFCDGAGAFAETGPVRQQIEAAKARVASKAGPDAKYIAYFQSFTNTYGPVDRLRALYTEAMAPEEVAALSIATRPDCISPEILELLVSLNRIKPVWIELGLQTIHQQTARFIRRGFSLECYETCVKQLEQAGLTVISHVILGLPGETREDMLATVDYLGHSGIQGIKLQLLHVLKDTDLAVLYEKDPFPLFSLEEYCILIVDCIERLPENMVIHRITGDGPRKLLIAPLWSTDKKRVLNRIQQMFRERNTWQGRLFT